MAQRRKQAIHISQVRAWKECPRREWYQYRLGFVPRSPQKGLFVGTLGHKALEGYYAGQGEPAVLFDAAVDKALKALGPDAELSEKVAEEIRVVRALLEGYPEWAKQHDNFRVLYTEQSFEVPIFQPGTHRVVGYHAGRLDGIVEDQWGQVWLLEHKFYDRWPNERTLALDEQCGAYLLAAARLYPNLRVRGVIYNVLRKSNPGTAKTDVYRRYQVVRSREELKGIAANLYHTVMRMRRDTVHIPSPGLHCAWCPYIDLCLAQQRGGDPLQLGPLMYDVVPGGRTDVAEEEEAL